MSTRVLRRIASLAIALGIGVLWMPSSAYAQMFLELASAGQGTIVSDGGTGSVTFNGAIGVFNINVTTGTSAPPLTPPPGEFAELDLNSVNVASGSAGTITIILEKAGYTGNTGKVITDNASLGGTITNGQITAMKYIDPTNAVPALSPLQPVGPLPAGQPPAIPGSGLLALSYGPSAASPFSAVGSTSFINANGTFSLYEKVTITFGAGGGTASFDDLQSVSVPEPSTFVVAGIGALGMIGYGLRRRRMARGD